MLRGLRSWIERALARQAPPTPEQAQRTAGQARHDRADTLVALRVEIRRLQQDIKDASDALERDPAGGARADHEGRLAALSRELDRKQRELAGLQARV
jgi:hypothetical protein